MNVAIVIPSYNEAATISHVVRDVFAYGDLIVVVDDGSSDATAEKAKAAGAVVIRHRVNRGQGAAIQTGTTYALQEGADIIVHFDADGQFLAKEIPLLLGPIERQEVAVVLGSRFLKNNPVIPWTKKYLLIPLGRLVNLFFTGIWLTDAHNGFRAVSRAAAMQVMITQDRMAHNTQIVAAIARYHLPYVEQPVTVLYHEYGQGIRGAWAIVKDLFADALFFKY